MALRVGPRDNSVGVCFNASSPSTEHEAAMSPEKKHSVKARLQDLDLSKAGSGIELEIFCDGEKLATIEIGHGSIGWKPARKRQFQRIDWSAFAEHMETWKG